MDTKYEIETANINNRLQNVVNNMSKCKIEFLDRNEKCKNLRVLNNKIEIEIKEIRELEKSHCQHLDISRKMVNDLQETVSQLVYVKRDVRILNEKISSLEADILEMERVKKQTLQKHNEIIINIRADYVTQIQELKVYNDTEIEQKRQECDAQVGMVTCDVEELKAKMREMESENRERINLVVLEYEEKLQHQVELKTQLQEQLSRETARSDHNINTYRLRLKELEEKLKHYQFKQCFQNIYSSPYGSQLDIPHSSNHQQYSNHQYKTKEKLSTPSQYKPLKCANPLQIIYNSKENSKKDGHPRKRKLFNVNEFLD